MPRSVYLLTFLLTSLAGCTEPSPDYCDQNRACMAEQVCDLLSRTCYSPPPNSDAARLEDGGSVNPQCAEDELCVAALADWSGPIVRADVGAEEALPVCAEGFSQISIKHSSLELSGSCRCQCGVATNLGCSGGRLRGWTSSESSCELGQCDLVGGACWQSSLSLTTNGCNDFDGPIQDADLVQASFGTLSFGSCSAPEASGELSSRFVSHTRLCRVPVSEFSCAQNDQVCARNVPQGFASGHCIMQEGKHECPADSEYSQRTLLFDDIDEQRRCGVGSCSCSPPTGSCGGRIELTDGGEFAGCTTVLASLEGATSPFGNGDVCTEIPASTRKARFTVDLGSRSCRQSGEASVLGTASGVSATTLCCSL